MHLLTYLYKYLTLFSAKKKKEYNRKIEQMRTEIQELHERFEEKFDELKNSGSRVAGSEKMKKKAVQQWGIDLNQSTYSMSKGNLLANTEKLSSKMTTKTADQSLFCDLNGRAGFFNYL